jgi:hypothetical protein
MRDNHDNMPEILDAFQEGAHYFAVVQIERAGDQRQYRFGVSRDGYLALKRVLQLRPFDLMPGVKNRHFFVPAALLAGDDRVKMGVRVEQGRDGRQLDIEAPNDLFSNLMWFYELNDWSKAEHLRVEPKLPTENARE